jgi:hypothetical protein
MGIAGVEPRHRSWASSPGEMGTRHSSPSSLTGWDGDPTLLAVEGANGEVPADGEGAVWAVAMRGRRSSSCGGGQRRGTGNGRHEPVRGGPIGGGVLGRWPEEGQERRREAVGEDYAAALAR